MEPGRVDFTYFSFPCLFMSSFANENCKLIRDSPAPVLQWCFLMNNKTHLHDKISFFFLTYKNILPLQSQTFSVLPGYESWTLLTNRNSGFSLLCNKGHRKVYGFILGFYEWDMKTPTLLFPEAVSEKTSILVLLTF